jgi:hypothetical protein
MPVLFRLMLRHLHPLSRVLPVLIPLMVTATLHAQKEADNAPATLTRAEALEDLDAFAMRLEQEAAYLALHQSRPFEAVAALRLRLPDKISAPEFARELRKILSPIGDCHSSITCEDSMLEEALQRLRKT